MFGKIYFIIIILLQIIGFWANIKIYKGKPLIINMFIWFIYLPILVILFQWAWK
jgi:hypothetical protein